MKTPLKKKEIAQTLQQAAKLLNIPLSEVKLAKRSGAKCFLASGRVDVTELKKYLLEHPPGGSSPATGAVNQSPPAPVDLSGLAASRDAAISVEERNLQLLRAAQDRNDAVAVQALTVAFEKSQRNRLAYEKSFREEQVRRGELIHISTHKLEGFKMWRPIIDCIRRIPRKATLEIAGQIGGDEALVHRILDRAVEDAIGEAKKMLTFPDEEQKKLARTLLLLAITGEDRRFTPDTIKILDSLRAVVVAELAEQGTETPPIEPEKPPVASEF